MEILRSVALLGLVAISAACAEKTVVETLPLETDTFISNVDSASHAELDYLQITKSAAREDRVILKLPTSKEEPEEISADMLVDGTVGLFLFPTAVLANLLICSDADIISAENLTSSELVFNLSESPAGAVTDQAEIDLLAKPWWQSVSWNEAHPFSVDGKWKTPGGDLDPNHAMVKGQLSGNELKFNVTEYFRQVINAGGTAQHFGFLIRGAVDSLQTVKLHSTQAGSLSLRPKLVSVYTGSCIGKGFGTYRSTTVLGKEPQTLREVIR